MSRPRKPVDARSDARAVRARLKDTSLEGWQRQRLQAAQLGLAGTHTLPQIAARAPEAMHIVIQDGAGFHLGEGAPQLPGNVRVLMLPPYSREWNSVEKFWDVIKDRICSRTWEDLEALIEAINAVLAEYWAPPSLVKSLIEQGWLLETANASYPNVLAAEPYQSSSLRMPRVRGSYSISTPASRTSATALSRRRARSGSANLPISRARKPS